MFSSSSAMSTLLGIDYLRLFHNGETETEARAMAGRAFHPNPSPVVLDDVPADGQPQARAVRLLGERVARLAELVEDDVLVLGAHAGPVVAHIHPQPAVALGECHLDAPR